MRTLGFSLWLALMHVDATLMTQVHDIAASALSLEISDLRSCHFDIQLTSRGKTYVYTPLVAPRAGAELVETMKIKWLLML